MSSRKTYFGIGVPGKDPAPTEKSPDDDDRSDYSAPTVVDDAKVAEGLKQLRAWYQPDANQGDDRESIVDSPSEPTKLGMPYPRPTAVGHSTSDTAPTDQRSLPADPMRGTMFGHDVHRPELDIPASPNDASVSSTSPSTDASPRTAEAEGHSGWRGPTAGARGAPMAPFADFLRREAARPRPPGGFHLSHADDTDSIAVSRRRITTNVLLAVFGAAAVVTAVMLGLRSATPEPTPSETVTGTSSTAPAGRAAGDVAPSASTAQGNDTPATSLPGAAADVPAPPVPAAQPATDLPRAVTGRTAAPDTSARAALSDAPRRTAPATKTPIARPAVAPQGSDTEVTTEAAADTAATGAPERTEARPSRSGRERPSRKSDSQTAARSQRDTPETKREDPDSTLPPSEE